LKKIGPFDYSLYLRFIEVFAPVGFKGITPDDPLLPEVEKLTAINNQYFFVADLIQLKILYSSNRITQMIGIKPEELSPYHFMELAHPQDLQRLSIYRANMLRSAQRLFIAGKGRLLISSTVKLRNPKGEYTEMLVQSLIFYNEIPYKTVFLFDVQTSMERFKKIKHGYHYYSGNNLAFFKYPDHELLNIGNPFSAREFEIIRLIESGLSSDQIARKLFLSLHTVNTHRRNILKKSGKAHFSEVIYDLQQQGLM
jgi:hypothetical protein